MGELIAFYIIAKDQISGKFITKHGMSNTLEYHSWQGMKKRALVKEKRYKTYEGKGISEEWLNSFEAFYRDMGAAPSPNHTIERKDNSIGYFKDNCKWATRKEQTRNYSLNRIIEYNGEKLCVTEWAEKLEIPRHIIYNRLNKGWSIEKTFNTDISLKHSHSKKAT